MTRTAPRMFFVLCVTAWAWPQQAQASACCGSGYGLGGRLSSEEDAAVDTGIRSSTPVASWNKLGRILPTHTLHHELRFEAAVLRRVADVLQVGAAVPWLFNARNLLGTPHLGSGLGDVTLSGRLDPHLQHGFPDVGFLFSAVLPTGRSYATGVDKWGADVTGQGLWELRTGLAVERTWMNGFMVTAQATLGWQATAGTGALQLQPPVLRMVGALGPTFFHCFSTVFGLQHERQVAFGRPPSEKLSKTGALAVAAWEIDPHWTAVASANADVPVPGWGSNEEVQVAFSAGLRWVLPSFDE